jgi:poly-gamma-glutamate synthesis protein (capsule biosynthesis protein)
MFNAEEEPLLLRLLLRIILGAARLLRPKQFSASRPVEGNAAHFKKGEAFWWGYKYFYRAIENPEPDKGIAEHFARQTMDFSLPEGFIPQDHAEGITIAAGGDIMPTDNLRAGSAAHLWDEAADFYFSADIRYANLEAPIAAGRELSVMAKNILEPPAMNNVPEAFDLCWRNGGGINFFSTANNHALDMGEAGLLDTLEFLDRKGVPHVGTSRTLTEQDDIPVIEKNGIRTAFLSYTFSTNRRKSPEGKEYLVNHLRLNNQDCDIALIKRHIAIARREKQADIIIACLHWSLEFESFPTQNTINRGHQLLEAGIDVIIGNHAHGLQPAECYPFRDPDTGIEKKGLIIYALGDLVSWQPVPNTRLTALARIHLQKGRLKGIPVSLVSGVEFKPLYSWVTYQRPLFQRDRCVDFRLLDLKNTASQIEDGTLSLPLTKKQRKEVLRFRALQRRVMPWV